jgi:hypothetical protein
MRELSEAGKAREKKRSKKRKAEYTGEGKPTKKKQKKQKKTVAETSLPAETSPIQQPLKYNDVGNSYYQQPAPEYPQDDFSDIFLLKSAQEYQVPEDNNAEYSNLLAPSEPTRWSQAPQQNGPGDACWVNYQGYDRYYYLLCPPDHPLYLTTITMNYWGTVEIQSVEYPEKHTPNYYDLPAEIRNIPLPPGIHFYNNPDHPVLIDPNTNTVAINCGRPIATESFENSPTNLSNTNASEFLAQDNSIYNNIDLQLSSSSEVSGPSLADPYANQFEPLDKGLSNPDDKILLGLNNYLSGTNDFPFSDFIHEDNMNLFDELFDEQPLSNSDILGTNNNVSDANLVDFETKDKETANAEQSPQHPISQPKVDSSGRFSTLGGFTFPVPASSRV